MGIISFEFENKGDAWRLQKTHFSPFNLLVGYSGVGKTKILEALKAVSQAGTQNAASLNDCTWSLEISIEGHIYYWNATTYDYDYLNEYPEPGSFAKESIILDGNTIIDRQSDQSIFLFNEKLLPKLNNSESAITLLKKEEVIAPLYQHLKHLIIGRDYDFEDGLAPNKTHSPASFAELQKAMDMPLINRAKILQEQYPDIFATIKNQFIEIFPTVQDISILTYGMRSPAFFYMKLVIEEKNSCKIIAKQMSSGMRRTLIYLLELALAPKDSIFLIDEIETSLGVNCLPDIIDAMRSRSHEVQFILTSHHPSVIKNIPYKHWKLIMRNGSEVRAVDANEIKSLQTKSAYDQFILLINTPEYEEGIA